MLQIRAGILLSRNQEIGRQMADFGPGEIGGLGGLGTAAATRGVATTAASLRITATAALEGTTGHLVGTAATTSGTATGEEVWCLLETALLNGDGVFADGDRAGLESSLVAIKGLEVDKGAVLVHVLAGAKPFSKRDNKLTLVLLASK
jgi:hypothetical protein